MTAAALAPDDWPVLVTGAGGFVGGHVARGFAAAGHRVVGLARKPPKAEPGDPPIEWVVGDLRDEAVRRRALRGVRGAVHAAGWVSLGPDPRGEAVAVNVEATRRLLEDAARAGVERFVYTSTLHTLAAGTAAQPADEDAPWNLHAVDSPYARTKREAERIVRDGVGPTAGVVICPGMVVGPRDRKPTSTRVLLMMAAARSVFLPGGGIPLVDAGVVAQAHRAAMATGEPGGRYAVVGPYLSYREMAELVARVAGRPRWIGRVPDAFERPLVGFARVAGRAWPTDWFSTASVAGGFLRLHVDGRRADRAFGLVHPPAVRSIYEALEDARRSGLAPRLRLREPSA